MQVNQYLKLKKLIFLIGFFGFAQAALAQSITLDPAASSSAIFEAKSNNKGLLPPKMTKEERKAIVNPEVGLLVFDMDKSCLFMYDGQNWLPLVASPSDTAPLLMREANDGQNGDRFGFSVDIEGNWAVIGAPYDDVNGHTDQGSVYIFKKSNGTWLQSTRITSSDGQANDWFGWDVDISGTTILIGAPQNSSNTIFLAGAVYVFDRVAINIAGNISFIWFQTAKLVGTNLQSTDRFGVKVALENNNAIVKAFGNSKIYTFEKQNNSWVELVQLTPNPICGTLNIGISGDYMVAGSSDVNLRKVFVYVKGGGTWSQQTIITPNDGFDADYFGGDVSIDGNYLLVSARNQTYANGVLQNVGVAYIFFRNGNTWTLQTKIFIPENDKQADAYFGAGIIRNDFAYISSGGFGTKPTVYIYKRNGTAWTLSKTIDTRAANLNFISDFAINGENALFSEAQYGEKGKVFFNNFAD